MKSNFLLKLILILILSIAPYSSQQIILKTFDPNLNSKEIKDINPPPAVSSSENEVVTIETSIIIDMLSDFKWDNSPWVIGTGTIQDPYIIQNLIINAQNEKAGIQIKNSLNFFWEITNCTFINAQDKVDSSGIIIENSSFGIIYSNIFLENNTSGIRLMRSRNISVSSNNFTRNTYGIYFSESENCSFYNNKNNFNDYGIYGQNSHDTSIYGNYNSNDQTVGMFFENSNDFSLLRNIYNNNNQGMVLSNCSRFSFTNNSFFNNDFDGILIGESKNCLLINNTISNNGKGGISLGSSSKNTIYNCIIEKNNIGIDLYSSSNNFVINNLILNNSIGIQVISSNDAQIHSNNISNNGIGIYIKGSSNYDIDNNFMYGNDQNLKELKDVFSWQNILIAAGIALLIIGISNFIRWKNRYSRKLK
ncbi:MAG: right-handed parallel beta-helix repeat-containing protein [Promethearchaeota archaeon]